MTKKQQPNNCTHTWYCKVCIQNNYISPDTCAVSHSLCTSANLVIIRTNAKYLIYHGVTSVKSRC